MHCRSLHHYTHMSVWERPVEHHQLNDGTTCTRRIQFFKRSEWNLKGTPTITLPGLTVETFWPDGCPSAANIHPNEEKSTNQMIIIMIIIIIIIIIWGRWSENTVGSLADLVECVSMGYLVCVLVYRQRIGLLAECSTLWISYHTHNLFISITCMHRNSVWRWNCTPAAREWLYLQCVKCVDNITYRRSTSISVL